MTGNETAIITSPNYPFNYSNNMECSYLLQTEKQRKLKINIKFLELESTFLNLCPDSLEIRYFALGQTGIRFSRKFFLWVLKIS